MDKLELMMLMDPRNRGKLPFHSDLPLKEKTSSKEAEEWNQQIKEWAEEQASKIDFTPQATALKPADTCRRQWIYSLCRKAGYENLGGIPHRACILIFEEINQVCSSQMETDELIEELKNGVQLVLTFLKEKGKEKLFDHPIAEIMQLKASTLEKFYLLMMKLYTDKREAEFGDMALFMLQLQPYVASYRIAAGLYYRMRNKYEEASFYFEQARQLNPKNPYGYFYGAKTAFDLNQKAIAEELLKALQELEGDKEVSSDYDLTSLIHALKLFIC